MIVGRNIYDNQPQDGTVIAKATVDEVNEFRELHTEHIAILRLSDIQLKLDPESIQTCLSQFKEHELKIMDFWSRVHLRLRVPYTWDLCIDIVTGDIFVKNENWPYYDSIEPES
ncbi:hypothetical protein [Laceyella sacchari]|jgi:hypothetical protein|uniref:Uncharacterized protein n=1 Tax=Laceyella sacchari TaxID=37482 RepID=A0ABY5U3M4_LACSH|nr:hypothetical protein [Laceyella sacchari]KPC75377.1 hypothetical protein ADL26_07785 [Thermoactinomyces vulgaris]UWE04243.1 hypothetical protein NYR52_03525 [Laceyella sacchari]